MTSYYTIKYLSEQFQGMSLDRTVKWIDKTEGRDKFCKSIQYACRFLKYRFEQKGDKETSKKFDSLFTNMRDARKLFRLFKSVNEFKKILDLMGAKNPTSFDNVMNIIVRASFMAYWFFDNLSILSKIKIISRDPKPFSKIGATFWLIALVVNLIVVVKDIFATLKTIDQLKKSYLSSPNEKEIQQKRTQFIAVKKKLTGLFLNVLKLVGDMIPAGQASQVIPNLFKVNASDGACGLGGLVSAVISSYQLYD